MLNKLVITIGIELAIQGRLSHVIKKPVPPASAGFPLSPYKLQCFLLL